MIRKALSVGVLAICLATEAVGAPNYGDFRVVGTGANAGLSFEFLAGASPLTSGLSTTFSFVNCTVPAGEICSDGNAQVNYSALGGVIRLTTSGASGKTRTWFFPPLMHTGVYIAQAGAGSEPGYVVHSGADATAGNPQSNATGSTFQFPLEVTLNTAASVYQSGVTVTFTAPGSGPGASLPNSGQATTDNTGRARITPTANGTPGTYQITATGDVGGTSFETSFVVANVNTANASGACQVTTANDDFSIGSLRYQVAACGKDGTITFAPGVTNVNLSAGQDIPLTQNLTIDGGSGVTINANGLSRIFFIAGGAITLQNLTLANGVAAGGTGGVGAVGGGGGAAGMGGAIFVNAGSLAINNVTFASNQAVGGNGGSVLSGFFSGGGGGTGGVGGSSSAGMNGNGGGGGDFGSRGGGGTGGVQNGSGDGAGGGNTGSGAFGAGGAGSVVSGAGGFGGGAGGALSMVGASGTFAGSGGLIPPNGGGQGGAGLGGAIFMRNGTLSLTNVAFSGNSAAGGTSLSGGSNGQGKGGAIYISSNASAVSTTALPVFSANSAANAGTGTSCNAVVGLSALDTNDVCGILTGPATHFSVSSPPSAQSSTTQSITVTALDANNNVATGYSGMVHLTATDPGFVNSTGDSTLISGTRTFDIVLKQAGVQSITAADTGSSSITGTSNAITVNPGPGHHFTVSAPPTAILGGSFPFTVTAYDVYGNTATGYSGTVHFTSADAGAVLPANSNLTNGAGTFNASLKTQGSQTITAADAGMSTIAGTSGAISVSIPSIVVTSTADSGAGTLRAALATAATGSANITFHPAVFASRQTITLASSLTIPSNTAIIGPSAGVTVSGGGASSNFSVFTLSAGVVNAAIRGLTITNGNSSSGAAGIMNHGMLTITNSTISGNTAQGASWGGGIYNRITGTLTLTNTTISGNSAGVGGGIFNDGTLTLTTSTISGNSAGVGGGIFNDGPATSMVQSSIIAGNANGDCFGVVCPANGSNGNVVGGMVNLALLANYGGSSLTMIPLPGSPAICAGINNSLPGADQRGFPRTTTYGSITCVDAGAVQTNYSLAFSTQPPASVIANVPFSAAVTLSESGSAFAQSGIDIGLALTSGGSFSPVSTSAGGIASFSNVAVSAIGPNSLTASLALTTGVSISRTSNGFTVAAGTATHFSVAAPPLATSWTPVNFIVTALDAHNNIATAYSGTVHFASTDPSAILPPDSVLTNGSGTFNFTPKTIGAQTLTATDTGNSITGTSNSSTVNPGLAVRFIVSTPPAANEAGQFPFSVTAQDAHANTATTYTGTVHFTSTDGAATLPSDSVLTNGTGSFNATLKTQGSQTITAVDTVTSTISGTSSSIAVDVPGIVVTSSADNGDGTLRAALSTAATKGSASITFDPNVFATPKTISLTSTLSVPSNTTITGSAAGVTVSGGGSGSNFSVFTVAAGVTNAAIHSLTIANGNSSTGAAGILNRGTLTIANSTISGNTAEGTSQGGGIYNANTGTLTLTISTISGNSAGVGGGIFNEGTLTLIAGTIAGNSGSIDAGGVFINGSLTPTIQSSIIAGNTNGECSGAACPANGSNGNIVGGPINLASLANYGGPTQTMIPLPGSPAICTGTDSSLLLDQRGLSRTTTYGSNVCVDAGAVQTKYSLSFSTQPPAAMTVTAPFSAAVTLSENGTVFQPAVSIPLNLTGGGSFSPVTTSNGIATFSNLTVNQAAGANTLTATLALTPSTSVTATSNSFAVDLAATVTSLRVSSTRTTVTLSATVASTFGTPTGTVQFRRGTTILAAVNLSSGTAIYTGSLSEGSVTAVYTGTAIFASGSSAPQSISYAAPNSPGLMSVASSANPSVFGQPVTFTVSFTNPGPNGTVQFSLGPISLGSVDLPPSGQATLTTSALPFGSSTVAVAYNGDQDHSSTQASIVQIVNRSATETTQSLSMAAGQATLKAAVIAAAPGAGTPTGTIDFQDLSNNNTVVATVNLSSGIASANLATSLAAHPIVAVYSGDVNFTASKSAPLPAVVSAVGVPTATYAPDEIISLYSGAGLSGDTAGTLPLTTTLAGVKAIITDTTGTPREASLYGVFGSTGQINLVIPSATATGPAIVTIALPNGNTVTSILNISGVSPGIFTANVNGQGAFAGSVVAVGPDYTQTLLASAAFDTSQNIWIAQPFTVSPHDAYIVLYGTGIRHASSVTATVGGTNVAVQYSGAQPAYPGLDQINVGPLPQSLTGAGQVNIVVTADGKVANTVTTAIK